MLNIITSMVQEPSERFLEEKRETGENNLQWLTRVMPADDDAYTELLLLGGTNITAFRLRIAQAQLRHDLTPSSWSHVVLLGDIKEKVAETATYEISLEPEAGFGFPVAVNGLQEAKLSNYQDEVAYPNIAHIRVPVERAKVTATLERYKSQRAVLDGPQLLLAWLSYVWAAGRATNPLMDGQGMPSAAMIEVIVGSAGFDLTPGLESRSSCPEAIWQAARWWYDYYEKDKGRMSLSGAFTNEHDFLKTEAQEQKNKIDADDFAQGGLAFSE